MTATSRLVPVTIVTGFLGSGKTTLLNNALVTGRFGRVAALVNDFGALDIDALLVAEVADEVVTLQNGCICCTINGDLYRSARSVLALDPPIDRIVIETTGLADPLPVALTFLETDLAERCVLEAIVTVVDSDAFVLDLFKADAAMAQIRHGDVIVLNKTDLADAQRLASIERRIGALKPQARILRTTFGDVPLDALFSSTDEPALLASAHAPHAPHAPHLLADGFAAHAYDVPRPLRGEVFQRWLDRGLDPAIFRAKGIFEIQGASTPHVFQFCAGRANFTPFLGEPVAGRLVVIGRDIDPSSIDAALAQCMCEATAGLAA